MKVVKIEGGNFAATLRRLLRNLEIVRVGNDRVASFGPPLRGSRTLFGSLSQDFILGYYRFLPQGGLPQLLQELADELVFGVDEFVY